MQYITRESILRPEIGVIPICYTAYAIIYMMRIRLCKHIDRIYRVKLVQYRIGIF